MAAAEDIDVTIISFILYHLIFVGRCPPLPVHKRLGGSQRPGFRSTNRSFVIFSRKDLRIGVSGAKFHEETDFDL